jgi:hypothetical protein
VAAWLIAGDVDGIRREVVNLRTGQTFSEDLWLESGGREQLEDWRRDATRFMDALDGMIKDGVRPARPGAGCMGCPWVLTCDDAAQVLAGSMLGGPREPDDLLRGLAVAHSVRDELTELAKCAFADTMHSTEIGALGWHEKPEREPAAGAMSMARNMWSDMGGDLEGFLAALPLSMGGIRKLAKVMHKRHREAQDAMIEQLSAMVTTAEFGVRRSVKP